MKPSLIWWNFWCLLMSTNKHGIDLVNFWNSTLNFEGKYLFSNSIKHLKLWPWCKHQDGPLFVLHNCKRVYDAINDAIVRITPTHRSKLCLLQRRRNIDNPVTNTHTKMPRCNKLVMTHKTRKNTAKYCHTNVNLAIITTSNWND